MDAIAGMLDAWPTYPDTPDVYCVLGVLGKAREKAAPHAGVVMKFLRLNSFPLMVLA